MLISVENILCTHVTWFGNYKLDYKYKCFVPGEKPTLSICFVVNN